MQFLFISTLLALTAPPRQLVLAGDAVETVSSNALPANIAGELRRFREEIEEQGQRLDRLYRILGPHLQELEAEAARRKQQQEEDARLLMERTADVSDLGLRGQGCANPAAAEFAVVTRGGAILIFDDKGSPGKRLRHPGHIITSVGFSPNGAYLLSGTDKGALLLWDLANGSCSVASTNVGQRVGRVAWLGNDRLVWGAYVRYPKDGKPANRDKPSGAVVAREGGKVLWKFQSSIRDDYFTLAGSLGGERLVVIEIPGQPRGASLLDGATGRLLRTCYDKGHGSGPLSVAISPNGLTLAVGYAPRDIILWDAATGEQVKLLKGHSNWVVSLAFSADSKRLISGAGDSTARVWDLSAGKEIGRLRFEGESTYVWSVGLSPAGDCAFALTGTGQLVVARVDQ